ncbi:hypothetical protein [Lentzea fradiae]|uniref:ATP dependent DNA ligase n=1 Tax=Lentzea fradiae TaxID=200378 RepID=UPI000B7CAA13
MLLGAYTDNGLTYIGRISAGFKDSERVELRWCLAERSKTHPPFERPLTREDARAVQWTRSVLVGQGQSHGWR